MDFYAIYSEEGVILSYKPLVKAEAILVSKDQVLGYGARQDIEEISTRLDAEQIYVDKPVLPAFIDAHLHLDSLGFELSTINLLDVKSREELLDRLRGSKPNIGEWIVAGRFDHLVFPDQRPPTRKELDNIDSQHPILLIHRSGHMGVLNTRGLELVRKHIRNNIDWENGWIYESSLWIIREKIFRSVNRGVHAKLLLRAQDYLLDNGILTVGIAGCDQDTYNTLLELDNNGKLRIRTYLYMYVEKPIDVKNIWSKYIESRARGGRVIVNGVKILLDGALGPRTAYLSQPYSDDPGNKGLLLYDTKWLNEVVEKATSYGLQVAIHSIGDAALDHVLKVYSRLGDKLVLCRHRIEHASVIRDDQLELIKKLKPIVVIQPHFIITDKWIIDRLGVERVRYIYRFKTLYDITTVGFSTDAPVEPVNPWETIYAAIMRGLDQGLKHGILTQDEKMTVIEALDAYTRGSGYALRDDKLGCLLPGCYPDMIVVDKNPLEISDPAELLDIKSKPLTPWWGK